MSDASATALFHHRPTRRAACLLAFALACAIGWGGASAPARADPLSADQAAGPWDVVFEKGNRRCRIALRPTPAPGGFALAMPAGCHRAFPIFGTVASWTVTGADHVVFQTARGAAVMDFAPKGAPSLEASVGEGGDVYTLTPADPAVGEILAAASTGEEAEPVAAPAVGASPPGGGGVLVDTAAPTVAAKPPAAKFPPLPAAEVAGHYAVLRDQRDTGCMVTLDAAADRARLAPACRDQGIVIFDPAGWQMVKGELVLVARKGHRIELHRFAERAWTTSPARGPALVLKHL